MADLLCGSVPGSGDGEKWYRPVAIAGHVRFVLRFETGTALKVDAAIGGNAIAAGFCDRKITGILRVDAASRKKSQGHA
jgi:hypothetical protein